MLALWIGPASSMDFSFGAFVLRIYAVTYLLNLFTIFPFYTMQGAGSTFGPMLCQLVAACTALLLGWLLGNTYGGRGVVAGLAIGVLVASLLVFTIYRRWLRAIGARQSVQAR